MKNNHTPEIRFAGFIGDWKSRELSDFLSHLKSGLSRMLSNQDIGLPVVRANNINNGILDLDNDIKYWYIDDPQGANTQNYLIHKNDILVNFINSEAKMGTAAIVDSEPKRSTIYTTNILNLRTNQDANPYFIYSLTMTEKYNNFIKTITKPAVNQASFTTVDFKKYEFSAPIIEEQSKIGKFFKQLDETISLHQQELITLKQTKKGFLQKMFPKEGESVPEIRFPGFTGKWVEKKLKEISIVITKGTTPADKSWEGIIKYIKTNSINSINGNIETTSRISKKEHEGNLKRSKLKLNDILFSIVGTLGRVGTVKEKDLPANTNQQICIIRLSEGDINFILMALKTPSIEKFIKSDATIGAQPSISLWQMEALKVPYPQIEEQQKIGNFFKQLDDTITLHQRKLDALKKTKKAFLQKMFV